MPFYVKGTATLIQGTSEVMPVCYPITRQDEPPGWKYTGSHYKAWDELAEIVKSKDEATLGEAMFTTEDGEDVPWSQVEWRDE